MRLVTVMRPPARPYWGAKNCRNETCASEHDQNSYILLAALFAIDHIGFTPYPGFVAWNGVAISTLTDFASAHTRSSVTFDTIPVLDHDGASTLVHTSIANTAA